MQPKPWLLVVVALALPMAAAGYGDGSTLEVDAPATIEGRADTLLPGGIASFVSGGPSVPPVVRLEARELLVTPKTFYSSCSGLPIPGQPGQSCSSNADDTSFVLENAKVTVVRAVSAYKVLVTTDRQHADSSSFGESGDIVVTTAGTTLLGTNDAEAHLSPSDADWASGDTDSQTPVYDAPPDSAMFTATGGLIRATGGFETFLQGVEITVTGTDADGNQFRETYTTSAPEGDGAYDVLIIEASDAELIASSTSAMRGFSPADQRPITDVHDRASFERATGVVKAAADEGGDQEYTDASATLEGPISLTLTKAAKGRLTYAIADGLQLTPLADEEPDEPIPPAALAAAGAAGAGGAGALIALAYFWPRLKYAWTLAFLPMYTRIERDAVLEHEKRDELYELIRAAPGIHAHEIGEKANIGWGTTVYHLKLLENHGLVVSKKSGRYKRFFVNTGEYTKKKDVYGALRNETAKAVADYVMNHPGTTQKELCAALSIQPSLASWHVEKLEGVALVKRVKDGRMVRYFAGPAWAELNVRVDPVRGGADTPAET